MPDSEDSADSADSAHSADSASSADSAQVDALARRAEDLRALQEAEQETALSGDQREVTGEISLAGQHPADVADFTYQREMQETTQRMLSREAEQVEAALRARERGTYGTCQECGAEIPTERLEARPEATLCLACQRQMETGRGA